MTTIEDLMRAALGSTDDQKETALKALRGELQQSAGKPVTGPLLLGMGAGAKFLGVSRATLYRTCQAGRIQKVELFPGSYRVRREDLEALAAGAYGLSESKSRRGRSRKTDGGVGAVSQ